MKADIQGLREKKLFHLIFSKENKAKKPLIISNFQRQYVSFPLQVNYFQFIKLIILIAYFSLLLFFAESVGNNSRLRMQNVEYLWEISMKNLVTAFFAVLYFVGTMFSTNSRRMLGTIWPKVAVTKIEWLINVEFAIYSMAEFCLLGSLRTLFDNFY